MGCMQEKVSSRIFKEAESSALLAGLWTRDSPEQCEMEDLYSARRVTSVSNLALAYLGEWKLEVFLLVIATLEERPTKKYVLHPQLSFRRVARMAMSSFRLVQECLERFH